MQRVRVTVDGKVLHDLPVDKELVVGRAPDVDLRIEDDEVSSKHLRIRRSGERILVTDLGSTNGTKTGTGTELKANEEVELSRGQKLVLGEAILELVQVDEQISSAMHDNAATVVAGSNAGQRQLVNLAKFRACKPRLVIAAEHDRRTMPLEVMEVTVGRDRESCEIVIDHQSISAKHAKLSFSGGRCLITDLGSANGTTVNGAKITEPTALDVESAVAIGSVDCLYVQNPPESGDVGVRLAEALAHHVVTKGQASLQQCREVLGEHRQGGRSIGEVYVEKGVLTPAAWMQLWEQREAIGALGVPKMATKSGPPMAVYVALLVIVVIVVLLLVL